MPNNVTTVPGATQVEFYLGNYAYTDIVTSMGVLRWKLDTAGSNRWFYKNAAGTLFKMMCDASDGTNHAQDRVLYTDSDGAAETSANLTFDGNDLTIASDNKLVLRDSAVYIHSGTDGYIDIVADTGINLKQETLITSNSKLKFRDANSYIYSDVANYLKMYAATGITLVSDVLIDVSAINSGITIDNTDDDSLYLYNYQRTNAGNLFATSKDGRMGLIGEPNTNMTIGTLNAKNLILGTTDKQRVVVYSNGNVDFEESVGIGLGSDSPIAPLHIHKPADTGVSLKITNSQTGITSLDGFSIGIQNTEDAFIWQYEDLDLKIATNNTERIRIKNDGKVGINETSPDELLHLTDTLDTALKIEGTTNSISGFLDVATTPVLFRIGTETNHGIGVVINNTTTHIFANDGKVGINETSPDELLHLTDTNNFGIKLEGTTYNCVGIIDVAGIDPVLFRIGTESDSEFGIVINNTTTHLFDTYGRLGINTLSPGQELDVNGNARIRSIGSTASAGALHYDSSGILTTDTSDERLKENIVKIDNALEKINSLRGVYFNWKSEPKEKRIGLIAQEVEKVIPELVFKNPVDEYKGIHHDKVVAVLIEAIKELNEKINILTRSM